MKFTEILSQLNIEYKPEGHHHCRPGWLQLDCPFCGKDSHGWHLGYSLEGNFLNCWRCGHQPIIKTLMEITGYSFAKCKRILSDVETVEVKKTKPKGKLVIPKGVGELMPSHIKYLMQRKFDYKDIRQTWKIQGIGLASQLSWRIFIPIFYHGKMVSWTTRSISNNKKITRYISASPEEESIPHKSLLYGEDYAKQSIIILEGPTDVWRIGPGAVATLGTGYSNEQVLRMSSYSKRAICFDNEKEAQVRAKKLCDDLSVFDGETYNIQLDSKDAATTSIKEIKLLRAHFLNY